MAASWPAGITVSISESFHLRLNGASRTRLWFFYESPPSFEIRLRFEAERRRATRPPHRSLPLDHLHGSSARRNEELHGPPGHRRPEDYVAAQSRLERNRLRQSGLRV